MKMKIESKAYTQNKNQFKMFNTCLNEEDRLLLHFRKNYVINYKFSMFCMRAWKMKKGNQIWMIYCWLFFSSFYSMKWNWLSLVIKNLLLLFPWDSICFSVQIEGKKNKHSFRCCNHSECKSKESNNNKKKKNMMINSNRCRNVTMSSKVIHMLVGTIYVDYIDSGQATTPKGLQTLIVNGHN